MSPLSVCHGWKADIPLRRLPIYSEPMKAVHGLARWVSSWGVAAWLAAALCLAPFAIMMFHNPPVANAYSPALWETLLRFLLLPISILFLLPFVAATQVVTFWLVRRAGRVAIQILLLLVSAAILMPYYRFLSTADLISTSTAPLAAMFYPIYLAAFAVPLNLGIYWLGKRLERGGRPMS